MRRPSTLQYEVVREMEEADLALLNQVAGIAPTPLKRLSDRHHALARLLASGVPEGEAALILNYDNARISILKASPAFQELLTLYRKEVDREFASVLEHMAGMSKDALMELRERLEETPDKFSNNELLRIVVESVDRTVAAPGLNGKENLPTRIELVVPEFSDDDSEDSASA